MPGVTTLAANAFAIDPTPVDWLFSDVVAYPAPLLALVQQWIAGAFARHIVCTIKLQGQTDHAAVAPFAAIPPARLMHLLHNKHELTFVWPVA